MGKCPALVIFLASSLLLVLRNLELVHALGCAGNFFSGNSTYNQNRHNLLSSLASEVAANRGFYNASLGQNPNRVRALVHCSGGYGEACISCVEKVTQDIQKNCPDRMDSFQWAIDDADDHVSCLVRSSNNATFRNLELRPANIDPSPQSIEQSNDMALFSKQWEATVNRTVEVATETKTSLPRQYFGAVKAEFTEFPTVYMLMQCTPDLTFRECKLCLETSVTYFKMQYWGRKGGAVSRPSCIFRWDLYSFHGAFDNATTFPAPPRGQPHTKGSSVKDKKGITISYGGIVAIIVPAFITLLVLIGLIKFCGRRRKSSNGINGGSAEYSDGQFMLRFDLGMISMATNHFSTEKKLGQGGFGAVYKGTLLNGSEIAVKRLTRGSEEGGMEFKNEVSLLTRLQHKNLVKLLGFCNEEDEEILVYEFVPNSSLDHFIFGETLKDSSTFCRFLRTFSNKSVSFKSTDKEKRSLLTWEVRFKIIEGVARGLVYLHEDSQLKIIHRDLKASNILLDAEMNPKVADFGTARLFEADETRAETKRIAGTRGYMAPEYLSLGQISAKSDVYSFGIVLLEMISGERNNSFEGEGIASFAWKRWAEGRPEVIIDPFLEANPRDEIIKLIQIGLLCVQENATKRPTMSSVIVWLGCETSTIALPKAPAFTMNQYESEDGTMSMSNVFTELSSR